MSDISIGAGVVQTGAIITAFWALLRWTVTNVLQRMREDIGSIRSDISDLKEAREADTGKIHAIDVRVTAIEAERKEEKRWSGFERRGYGEAI